MSLSVCLITADPAGRIATILEPLRPFADEIVIAADARVDEAEIARYASLADRLFRIEYCMAERHLSWLCAQCEGDWILRLDGDEVPSAGFVRRLPEMLSCKEVHQFWSAQAWLYPDREHVLSAQPWADDFHVRLFRNDGMLRSQGIQHLHIEPLYPREYVEEPFYHLDLLIAGRRERRDKAIRYEVARPGLQAAGGGRINEAFYLPELRGGRIGTSAVADEDREAIARALDPRGTPVASAPIADVPFVTLRELDRLWEQRAFSEEAYRARIEPWADGRPSEDLRLAPGEQRALFFRIANEGDERWPCDLQERPQIRLGYRWLNRDGSPHSGEGPRSPFPRRVNPGEQVLAALHVDAPGQPGRYVLEVDVVHEHVRWFDCACRVAVRVQAPEGLPAAGPRLSERTPSRWRRMRRSRIPKTLHRVWLGDRPTPEEHVRFGHTWAERHPAWHMRVWTDEDLPALEIDEEQRARTRTASELSNLVRYEVLRRHGGVYVDTDVECKRPLDPLLRGVEAFTALELPGRTATGVLGAVADHPLFERAARLARLTLGLGAHSADANGPYFFTLLVEQEPGVTIFPAALFYPYLWDEPERRHESFPDAYAVHHWARSWWEGR